MKTLTTNVLKSLLIMCIAAIMIDEGFAQLTKKEEGSETKQGSVAKEGSSSASEGTGTKMVPVAVAKGVAKLGPMNSKIEFIGTHAEGDPKPRLGGFKNFSGEIKLGDDNSVESLSLEIDIDSVWTEFEKLTNHLKNADFFETEKHDKAKFVSTKITASENGMKVTGNLTLHGVTKEVSFPVNGKLDEAGVVMTSEFTLDRTMFGMDQMTGGVKKEVSVRFVVGEKTIPRKAMPGPGAKKKSSATETSSSSQLVALNAPNMT